ncbi:hypothetical protein P4O66_000623 [Electrophorus voltai]|uniref:G-protein coupled receptors family 1 profile domain-containing protein n=1 Tax=Electrophorus voltai TaxID=2609070 RepID=A0AAD8ZGN5_9TELE|nr:hypothetical protein P4O66_000623 [Electrophorus voltai]
MNTTLPNSTTGLKDEWIFTVSPIFIILIHGINFLLGFPLNAYLIFHLFSRCKKLDSLPDLSQALVDILFVPMAPLHCLCSVTLDWCFTKPLGFLMTTTMSARTLFQCWVCVERYLAVIHPLAFLRYKPLRYRLGFATLVWAAVITIGITGFLTFPYLPYKVFTAMYLFILSVDVFCCMSILKNLRRPGPRDSWKEEGDIGAIKKKALLIVTINLLIFLVQNIPIAMTFVLQNHLSFNNFYTAMIISLAINILSGLLQPVSALRRAGKPRYSYICFCKVGDAGKKAGFAATDLAVGNGADDEGRTGGRVSHTPASAEKTPRSKRGVSVRTELSATRSVDVLPLKSACGSGSGEVGIFPTGAAENNSKKSRAGVCRGLDTSQARSPGARHSRRLSFRAPPSSLLKCFPMSSLSAGVDELVASP